MDNHQAEAFALADRLDALDMRQATGAHDVADPLIHAAMRLASAPHPELPAERLVSVEAKVLQTYRMQRPAGSRPVLGRTRGPLRWAIAAIVALALFVGGLTPVVSASVPGDTLYPVKGFVEQFELVLAASPEAHAATYVLHAERRLAEVRTLIARGSVDGEILAGALAGLQTASLAVSDLPAAQQPGLVARTEDVTMGLTTLLQQASDTQQVPPQTVMPLLSTLQPASTIVSPSEVEAPANDVSGPPTDNVQTGQTEPPAEAGGQGEAEGSSNANCDNPPPEEAKALGWRQRCEGGGSPSESRPGQDKRD